MTELFKYRAFISYSHADEEWARWLHKALETYRVPKRLVGRETGFGPVPERVAPIFRDRDELPTATSLGATLTQAQRKMGSGSFSEGEHACRDVFLQPMCAAR
jgi:hypothetical protein